MTEEPNTPEETTQPKKFNRRTFIRLGIYSIPVLAAVDGFLIEPNWVSVKNIYLNEPSTKKIVLFSDLHYRGNKSSLDDLIKCINQNNPDFVCFTGDIVEDKIFLDEALDGIKKINAPVYGVPGNHDYWSGASFLKIAKCFEATGGKWLLDEFVKTKDNSINISGVSKINSKPPEFDPDSKNILLTHYPAYVDHLQVGKYNLIMAGHSHGGQCRIPFYGALILPQDVGKYQKGLYQTPNGPLYVNPGIGYWMLPVRFFCRPELTVIKM